MSRIWLVLADPFPTRVFFDCGIVDGLAERLPERLVAVPMLDPAEAGLWSDRARDVPGLDPHELVAAPTVPERARRRADRWLDERIGFYPLALRLSLRHGFLTERMRPGHSNWFLDPDRAGSLPRWRSIERAMYAWHFGSARHVPAALLRRMRADCAGIVVTNLQTRSVVPFLAAARRLAVPVVGYISSWDHTVGKGAITPHAARYVVQNDVMRDDLVRYHGVPAGRVAVTGWPQTDVFHRRRPRAAYEELLRGFGLEPSRPLVMVMGNTPTNAPYEERFVERLVGWWEQSRARDRFSLLLRPHPRDREWRRRFGSAVGRPGAYVQEPSYADIEVLATLLQHGDCVVANAGTILLDSLVNDRPAVCVLYDEGAPAGESWAALNVVGAHYRALMTSDAFYRAERFEEVAAGIERALTRPEELAQERRRVAGDVVGEVDGRAGERVVDAIVETLAPSTPAAASRTKAGATGRA